jgi:hypothetical protein
MFHPTLNIVLDLVHVWNIKGSHVCIFFITTRYNNYGLNTIATRNKTRLMLLIPQQGVETTISPQDDTTNIHTTKNPQK